MGDWGKNAAFIAGASSTASGFQATGNALAAGSNQRTGLVADGVSSAAAGLTSLGAVAASKVLSKAAGQAATAFDTALENYQQVLESDIPLVNDYFEELSLDAATKADKAQSISENASKYPTPIIDTAILLHTALSLANGFGAPNGGTQLGSAAGELDWAVDRLATAGKTDGWTSPDAEPRYRNANTVQQERVAKIAEIDRKFEKALKDQATQVYDLKGNFGYIKTAMNSAKIVAIGLNMLGEFAMSSALQLATATACIPADIGLQSTQRTNAQNNRTTFESLAGAYQGCQQP
jgi:hypothetical protein